LRASQLATGGCVGFPIATAWTGLSRDPRPAAANHRKKERHELNAYVISFSHLTHRHGTIYVVWRAVASAQALI
jgi:hypothetical protein